MFGITLLQRKHQIQYFRRYSLEIRRGSYEIPCICSLQLTSVEPDVLRAIHVRLEKALIVTRLTSFSTLRDTT